MGEWQRGSDLANFHDTSATVCQTACVKLWSQLEEDSVVWRDYNIDVNPSYSHKHTVASQSDSATWWWQHGAMGILRCSGTWKAAFILLAVKWILRSAEKSWINTWCSLQKKKLLLGLKPSMKTKLPTTIKAGESSFPFRYFFVGTLHMSVWMCVPHCGILSWQDPGVFAEVQMQQRIGVVITWTQRLGQRNHTWRGERGEEMEEKGSDVWINNFYASLSHLIIFHSPFVFQWTNLVLWTWLISN